MDLQNLPSGMRFKKIVSLIVAISFIFSNLALADTPKTSAQDSKKEVQITTDPEKIVIPRDYGIVKAKYTSKDPRKLVVHIQDAHCNYEAQSNIIKILECLIKNDGLGLISVEGADGFIDTSWFKAFPDADIRKEVADYFMKKGEITGPEFLAITSDYPIKLFGAETRSYYIENLNAFTSSYPLKEDTEKYFNQIKAILNKLKGNIYSEELKELDAKSQDYESKKMSFTDYVKYLEVLAVRHKINLRQYENLFKLVSVLVYEKKINFTVVDKERATLIDVITKKLDKDQLKELVNKSLEFKVSKISSVEYYEYLKALASKFGIYIVEEYPNLFNYIIYNSVYSKIENEKLFNDIKKFEEAIKEKLFANDDQRTLDKLSRHINILLGLTNIRLLNGDFEYYKENKEGFSHEVFADFIKKMATKFGFAYEVDAPSEAVIESMPKLEDFYAIAIKRDKALVDNTIQAMKKEGAQISVLVTGGFHSEGITKLLEKQGMSYLVICPNITKDVETPYIKILTNQRTPLEEILSDTGVQTADTKNVKGSMLAPHLITAANISEIEAISGRTERDLDVWARMNIAPWLPKAASDLRKLGLNPTEGVIAAHFSVAVNTAVEKHIADNKLKKDEAKALRQAAREVKKIAPSIIAELLKTQDAAATAVQTSTILSMGDIDTLIKRAAKAFKLGTADAEYLKQMWIQYLTRIKERSAGSEKGEESRKPLRIVTDTSKLQEDVNRPLKESAYNPKRDGNFILASSLTADQREKILGAFSYAEVAKDRANAQAVVEKNVVVTINSLDGGIGESVDRLEFLREKARAEDRPIENIKRGAKGTDLGFYITFKGVKGSPVFVSIAEIKLMQLVGIARSGRYSGMIFQPIVNADIKNPSEGSKASYDNLLDNTIYLLDRFTGPKAKKRTYRELLLDTGIHVAEMVRQPDLPGIGVKDQTITLDYNNPHQPGGHGQLGFLFLYETFNMVPPKDTNTDVRVFYNGDNTNSRVDENIAGLMAGRNLPIIKLTTSATPIDKKGGKDGVRIIKTRDNRILYVPDQMEERDAKNAGQLKEFYGAGMENGFGSAVNQPFNTNIFYVNTRLLHSILTDLVSKGIITEEKLYEIISPILIDKDAKKGPDGYMYVPIDGAIGTAMHRLNEFYVTCTDTKMAKIRAKYGDRLLYFVDVPRTQFFTPVKKTYDIWMQGWSDYYILPNPDINKLELTDATKVSPPEFDLECLVNKKETYWHELQNLIDSFGNASTAQLKSLKIRGKVLLRDAKLIGNISIENESDELVDLSSNPHWLKAGKLVLENISIKITRGGLIGSRPITDESDVGAIRVKGGIYTVVEHGTRLKGHSAYARNRLKILSTEKSINGAISRLIKDGSHPVALSLKGALLPGDNEMPLFMPGKKDAKLIELEEKLQSLGINFIIIKSLKKELEKSGVAQDLIFHYGVTRRSVYIDEDDFRYFFSLPNGVDIIMEGAKHEVAHINNEAENLENPEIKLLSEEEIEESASSYNVRKALAMRDKDKRVEMVDISSEELAIKRVFGTNGIRSDDMGEDAQRRIAAGTAEILKEQWEKANPGKELPWLMVGFDPRPQGVNGFKPGEMGESKAVAETLAAYGFKVLFVPKPVAAPFMISVTGKEVHPKNIYASVMRTASHNEVVDPRSGRLVSGVKLFIDNAPASDAVTGLISGRINDKALARIAPRIEFDKAVASGNIVIVRDGDEDDPDTVEFNRLNSAFDLKALGEMFRQHYPDLKIAVNTMNGGMSNFALRVFKAMGFKEGEDFRAFNTTLMNDSSMEAKMTGWVEYTDSSTGEHKRVRFAPDPTRAWMRGKDYTNYVTSDPAHVIALLIDGDADRLVAELEKEIIPNDIGMLAAYYLAKYKGQKGRIVRTVPTTGGLDALSRALGLGKVQVTPVGSKWFAGPNKYYDGTLNNIVVAVEESGHIGFVKENKITGKKELFFDHSIGLSLLMIEMMAETGKTWQELSDEMWAFIKEKTGQERIAAVRYGISKDEGAEKYYDLVARLGNPKEDLFRKEFGSKFEKELAVAGLPWEVEGFDITDSGGAQFIFKGGRKLFPRKSGTDGSVRLYIEVLESERDKAPELVNIMRKVMDSFITVSAKVLDAATIVKDVRVISQKLHTPLVAATGEMAIQFMQNGYNQIGYGIPAGAAIDGSFAIGAEGNQGYYVNGGKEIFVDTINSMKTFLQRRAETLNRPMRYIIKPGIGGQHTPFQGIASAFQVIDMKAGTIVGEYELGKDYEIAMRDVLNKLDADWDEIIVMPSSKSGSTDETMMIFSEIFYIILKNVAQKEGFNGLTFANTILDLMHEVNFKNGKELPAKDLFKGFNLSVVTKALQAKGLDVSYEQVKGIFGIVLGNMFFETTDRPDQSRLSAFIRNSGLDKELGVNAPGFGAMFDNVGGRWTADLHMRTFLAFHKLDAEAYWNTRYEGVKKVREGTHKANELANRILNEGITDIALVVPDELFWFGKAMEQNFNESIWQKGFANLIAIKESAWEAQKSHYAGKPARLVINISSENISGPSFKVADLGEFKLSGVGKQELANSLGELFTTFYGMTHTVGNALIVKALAEKGYTANDVDLNDLNNPATRIVQQNLYVRQPYVELGKGLLEKKLKALQERGPKAIEGEFDAIIESAKRMMLDSKAEGLDLPKSIGSPEVLDKVIRQMVEFAKKTDRKFVPFIYLEGGKFLELRELLVSLGIEWVMQGTGDQHISYQQVLAQPQKYLPFIISFVPEKALPGRPAIGFAKGYLHNISPNMVRDLFAEASYKALTEPRKNEAGEDVKGAAGIFLRMTDSYENRDMFAQSFKAAIDSEKDYDRFDHTIESIIQSSNTGERARKTAETIFAEAKQATAERHLIFVKSAIPAEQLATTTAINYANYCADYYNDLTGYTADIVDTYEDAVKLLAKNPNWDKTNTIVGLIDKQSLDKMTEELEKNGMQDKTKLLPMERFDKDQFVPLKGFFDLMSVLVQINRPLDKPEDRELKDDITDLLNEIGVRDVSKLISSLSIAAYFDDPIKFAKNFIIRLLPPTKASDPAELRDRYNAAKKVVESL